jgi:hypothetical protein
MSEWCGKIFAIVDVSLTLNGRRYFFYNMPPRMMRYCWSEDMFELVEESVLEISDDEIIDLLSSIR